LRVLYCVGVFAGVLVEDPTVVGGVDYEVGARGLGEEDGPVVGAGAWEVAPADEDAVVQVMFNLAAPSVDVGVGVGSEGGDEEEGVEVGGVDAEAVLCSRVCSKLLREFYPLPGEFASSADHDELMSLLLEPPEGVRVA